MVLVLIAAKFVGNKNEKAMFSQVFDKKICAYVLDNERVQERMS